MAKVYNGFTPDTVQNLQLDAGIWVRGLADPSSFNGDLVAPARTIGATAGGGTITAVPTYRNLFEDLDGARGSYKGGTVIDGWEIKATTTIKEITAENLHLSLGAADITVAGTGENYDTIVPRMQVEIADYLDNLCFIGTMNGKDLPVIVELKNVLNTSGLKLTVKDKDKGGVELELVAHFDLEDTQTVPMTIYMPKKTA